MDGTVPGRMNLREPAVLAFSGLAVLAFLTAFVVAGRARTPVRLGALAAHVAAVATLVFRVGSKSLAVGHGIFGILVLVAVVGIGGGSGDEASDASDDAAPEREVAVFAALFMSGIAAKIAFDHPWKSSLVGGPPVGLAFATVFVLFGAGAFLLRANPCGVVLPGAVVAFCGASTLAAALFATLEGFPPGRAAMALTFAVYAIQASSALLLAIRATRRRRGGPVGS